MISISDPNKNIKASVSLPASKSLSNRVLIIRALCGDDFEITNLSVAKDTSNLKAILESPANIINAGDGGTTLRFLLAFLALKGGEYTITGSASLIKRPIEILTNALSELGVRIDFTEAQGRLPIRMHSNGLTGNRVDIDGSISSQFISALMLIAPYINGGLKIQLKGELISLPYILMTKSVMEYFGVEVAFKDVELTIPEGRYKGRPITIESDWSAASYWYEIAALSDDCDIMLKGLSGDSLQGDSKISEFMQKLGVDSEFKDEGVRISKIKKFSLPEYFSADFSGCPDLGPAIAVTCGALNITADLHGLKNFRLKESDRASAIQRELYNFNIKTDFCGGSKFKIYAGNDIRKSKYPIKTYNDHRMAMAFAPLGLKVGEVQVEEEVVVEKSYPGYFDDLQSVFGSIEIKN